MLRLCAGLPGSGKTLFALWTIGQAVQRGRPVATNIRLNPECPFYNDVVLLDDDEGQYPVCRMPDEGMGPYKAFWHYLDSFCHGWYIVIDEADNVWDSSPNTKYSNDARLYFKQHRKLGHDLLLIVQDVNNLWVRIRRMVQSFVVCEYTRRSDRITRFLPVSWSSFIRGEFSSPQMTPDSLIGGGRFWYDEGKEMFGWYDTDQLLGSTAHYAQWYQRKKEPLHDFSGNIGQDTGSLEQVRGSDTAVAAQPV